MGGTLAEVISAPESTGWKAVGPRVSEFYRLGLSQSDLHFVDVDLLGDDPLFVDPFLLRTSDDPWAHECVALVQDYFKELLAALRNGPEPRVRELLSGLREPNETHLGYSSYLARGRGIGAELGDRVGKALSGSKAIETGVLEDLEDTVLMVPGIGRDLISDLTTNIIRGPLVGYTGEVAGAFDIGLSPTIVRVWDRDSHRWEPVQAVLPRPEVGRGPRPLLLVPKSIVRIELTFKAQEYYRHFMLEYLAELELSSPNSELVRMLKDNTPWVAKKDLIKKYGSGKEVVAYLTGRFPNVLDAYRGRKRGVPARPATPGEVASALGLEGPDFDKLLADVLVVPAGRAKAGKYHRAIAELLKALFHPDLVLQEIELEINSGRKRIDIGYTNVATEGFFHWLANQQGVHAPRVFAECKNYNQDLANPELDQLAERLNPFRGQFGMLVCRSIDDRDWFQKSCQDALKNGHYMIGIDDADLRRLVETRKSGDRLEFFRVIKSLFDPLVM
jgi:hypothetical protein